MADQLLELLNKAIARELGVSIQYMWQHVTAMGMKSPEVKDIFEKTAIAEMKHAEKIAQRLFYLGGTPTTELPEIIMGDSLKEMIEADLRAEDEAIELYKEIIGAAEEDSTTRLLFEEILMAEEEHKHTFTILLK